MKRGICLAGSARPEMLNPSFWGGGDEVRMTTAEIRRYNQLLTEQEGTGLVELSHCPPLFPGQRLRNMIRSYPIQGRFLNGCPITDALRAVLLSSRNLDAIQEQVPVGYATTLCAADVRAFPTRGICSAQEGFLPAQTFDLFQESLLPAGEGVLTLHSSLDQKWCFVQAGNYFGWVEKEKLTPCGRDHFLSRLEQPQAPLPYTTANLYRLALSRAGLPYRWGRFDCSELILSVYRPFGFLLPRNTSQMERIPFHRHRMGNKSAETISQLAPGALLLMPGHVMLYLGCVERRSYVLQAFTRYSDADGTEHQVFSTAVTSLDDLYHRSGPTFLARVTAAIELKRI